MMQLRPARPEDQTAIMALIDAVYHEYGDRLCLENADRDLLDVDAYYVKARGAFVVLDDAGRVRGTHAVLPEAARASLHIPASLPGSGPAWRPLGGTAYAVGH